jgi:hypothetical protein
MNRPIQRGFVQELRKNRCQYASSIAAVLEMLDAYDDEEKDDARDR